MSCQNRCRRFYENWVERMSRQSLLNNLLINVVKYFWTCITPSSFSEYKLYLYLNRGLKFAVFYHIPLSERAGEEGQEQFVREISFMQRVGTHRNVLSMIGYWDRSEPIMLILEYVPHGDLLQWLRKKRQQVKIFCTFKTRIHWRDHWSIAKHKYRPKKVGKVI